MHIGLEFSRKGLLEVIKSIPLLKAGPTFKLQWAVQLNSEYFQGRISTLSGQPIPVLKYLTEEFFSVSTQNFLCCKLIVVSCPFPVQLLKAPLASSFL